MFDEFKNKIFSRLFIMAMAAFLTAIASWLVEKPIPPDIMDFIKWILGIFAGRDGIKYLAENIGKKKKKG